MRISDWSSDVCSSDLPSHDCADAFRCASCRRRSGGRACARALRGQLSSNGRYPVPMPSIRHLLATLLACILPFALAACVSTPPPASPAPAAVRTPLVLVSLDGGPEERRVGTEGV